MQTVTGMRRGRGHSGRVLGLALAALIAGVSIVNAGSPTPPIRLVDGHTAGTLPKGTFQVESRLYPSGSLENGTGLLVGVTVGITDRFCLGLGYGGEGIVGRSSNAKFNPFPGCVVKYRIVDENFFLPGFALGFDYQGYGGITDESRFGYTGYIYKSQGFFLAASKSYLFFKTVQLGIHGDLSFSMEDIDHVTRPNVMVGADIGLSELFSFVLEYDMGLNTSDHTRPGDRTSMSRPQDGYLHAGVRLSFSPGFAVEIDARDITENRYWHHGDEYHKVGWSRELKVVYTSQI